MSSNLESYAEDCLNEALYDVQTLAFDEIDALIDKASERAHESAENACIYYSHCLEIISRYERDAGNDVDDYISEQTFKADQWQEAAQAYAYAIAVSIIQRDVYQLANELKEAHETLTDAADEWGFTGDDGVAVAASCIHGWAPHDKEDEYGTHFWSEGELEGCRAVAIKAAGIWLSLTWTPATSASEVAE